MLDLEAMKAPTDSESGDAPHNADIWELRGRITELVSEVERPGLTELALALVAKHGTDRYPTLDRQCLKLLEETGELARCILRGEDVADEIADVEISLRMLAYKAGVSIEGAVAEKVTTDTRTFA
jgi:hypothetical protein